MPPVVVVAVIALVVIAPVVLPPAPITLPVTRHVDLVVPLVLHEIDRPPTGVILVTVLAPMLRVTRRHAEGASTMPTGGGCTTIGCG
jgi:hypothetical protein